MDENKKPRFNQDAKLTKDLEPLEQIISKRVFDMVLDCLENQIPFTIVVNNHNNWDQDLPKRLMNSAQFLLNINNDTLSDAQYDEESFTIKTLFDGELYTKKFYTEDVVGIAKNNTPYIMKPFLEKAELRLSSTNKNKNIDLDKDGIEHSMKMFKKYNPEMFE